MHLDLESETQSTCAKENSKEKCVYKVSIVKRITSLSGENNMAQQESSSRNMLFAHSYTSLGFLLVVVVVAVVSSIHFLDILGERDRGRTLECVNKNLLIPSRSRLPRYVGTKTMIKRILPFSRSRND